MARSININSPGVEIAEIDLSLRVETAARTQIFIPGFASQGPISEPILITSVSELESVFGAPTTPAERYFYYSCREVLASPGVLNAIRLPYGPQAGEGYSNAYSCLLFPVASADSADPKYDTQFTIGSAVAYSLTPSIYESIKSGNYSFGTLPATVTTPTVTVNSTTNAVTFSNVGFIVFNDIQSTINDVGEGYYIGFVDNAAAATADFDSINKMYSVGSQDSSTSVTGFYKQTFKSVSPDRLEFKLSATSVESSIGMQSISEALEKPGFSGFENVDYQDTLSFGVYKVRRSVANISKLGISSSEKLLGSLNSNRKEINLAGGGALVNGFLEERINTSNPVLQMLTNPAISRDHAWNGSDNSFTVPHTKVTVATEAQGLWPLGTYVPDTRSLSTTKQIGDVALKLDNVFKLIDNPENVVIDIIADAGISSIYAGTSAVGSNGFDDNQYFDETALETAINSNPTYKNLWTSIVNKFITFTEQTRRDCIAIIDPPRPIFVSGKNTKTVDKLGSNFTSNMYTPLKAFVETLESAYTASYANWVKVVDSFSGSESWIPFSGYAAAVYARSDTAANVWAAPAGFNRGEFKNVVDIAFNPNQKQRDRFYELAINPVAYFSGDGYTVFGQKTLQNKPSAFDRINVRRLFLYLERAVARTVKYFVFEPNTEFTRKRLKDTISPLFNYAKATQGIYDYMIVCDDRNNTPEVIDDNAMIVDIYIKPVRTAEFILVNFVATRTGQNFQELL